MDVVVAANGSCEPTLLEGSTQGSIGGSNICMGLALLHLHVVYASHGFSIGLIPTGAQAKDREKILCTKYETNSSRTMPLLHILSTYME